MLKNNCIHPDIMRCLSLCGHGDKILIADGNYPLDAKTGDAHKIYVGVMAGLPTVTQVLEAILGEVNIEAATVMKTDDGSEPPIFDEFKTMLGLPLDELDRYGFYDACSRPDVRFAVSTGEKRIFANILITVGVA